jgi:hypothetical protein
MTRLPAASLFLILVIAIAVGQHSQTPNDGHSADYRAMVQKLTYLKINATKAHPDPKPVELSEAEVNAYFGEGGVKLPKGVSQVHLASKPGVIDGHAHVDFEEIMQGRNKNNPMYSLFNGSHDIHVVAGASGVSGVATIKAQTVELDGAAIPDWALEFFVQRYITPRYPNVGMTSTFKMPLRIQSATVETGKLVLEQR